MAIAGAVIPPLHERPVKNTICLFDVDGTLTPARKVSLPVRHSTAPLPYKLTSRPSRHASCRSLPPFGLMSRSASLGGPTSSSSKSS